MIKIVLDTDVIVAAFTSNAGMSRKLLHSVFDGDVRMMASTALFLEYEAVLTRTATLERSVLSLYETTEALDLLADFIEPVGIYYQWRPVARDPDDDFVIETAVNAVANYIVTFNLKDMQEGAGRFGIETVRPAEIIRRMNNE